VGRHYVGPTWEHADGSAVVGKAVANSPGATADDVPWLKLQVIDRGGAGALADVEPCCGSTHAAALFTAPARRLAPFAARITSFSARHKAAERPAAMAIAAGPAYVTAMADAPNAANNKFRIAGRVVLFCVLFAILIAAGWYAASAWSRASGTPMPAAGYVAMILGVVFSLVVGCGLMALLFYSNRHGYDEPHRREQDRQQ